MDRYARAMISSIVDAFLSFAGVGRVFLMSLTLFWLLSEELSLNLGGCCQPIPPPGPGWVLCGRNGRMKFIGDLGLGRLSADADA